MFIVLFFCNAANVSIWSYTIGPLFGFLQGIATMHIEQFESFSHLPTLDALDAEFRAEKRCAAGRNRKGGDAMQFAVRSTQPEFPQHLGAAEHKVDRTTRPSREAVIKRSSLGRRALRSLAGFLILFSAGIGATLGWQSYGNAARAMIANSSTNLGWLAPPPGPGVQTAPDVLAPTPAATASSDDVQQLAASVASVRQSVDQLAIQFAFGQRQMADNIAKLQSDEREILQKLSAPPIRPNAAPARKPVATTSEPSPAVHGR